VALYAQLLRTLVSPRFHATFALARLRSAIVTASWTHRAFVVGWLAILVAIASIVPWWAFAIAIGIPLGPGYQISALLQFLTEHRWLERKQGPKTPQDLADRTIGRFALVEPPPADLGFAAAVLAWAVWSLAMIGPLLMRLGVWVGDMPVHDHHHVAALLHDRSDRWYDAMFARERAIDQLGLDRREAYGLMEALDWVFEGLSSAERDI
jgi:hypothetical protein